MNASDREKVYVELRNYHIDKFPDTITNVEVRDLRTSFGVIEDKVVLMLLRFVNGKEPYVDLVKELEGFKTRFEFNTYASQEKSIIDLLVFKMRRLGEIMLFARAFDPTSKVILNTVTV